MKEKGAIGILTVIFIGILGFLGTVIFDNAITAAKLVTFKEAVEKDIEQIKIDQKIIKHDIKELLKR